ncbi:MAG TPA: ABC transporter permease, partial [Vicinamibacterales bacterium]|nr:ABC transporter permease [Vicinamibacterales bacterium]
MNVQPAWLRAFAALLSWIAGDHPAGRAFIGDLLEQFERRRERHPVDAWLSLVADGLRGAIGYRLRAPRMRPPRSAGNGLTGLWREAVYAARILRRSPGLTLLSVVTMGAGIGAGAVLSSLVHAIVLQPLPYPEPDRLVRIFDTNIRAGIERAGAASGNIDDWRRRSSGFDGIAGFYAMGRTLSNSAGGEVLITAQVSEDFFPIAGVRPEAGRTFIPAETRRARFNNAAAPVGPDPVAILSHRVWRQRFGADPGIVGRSVTIERRPFEVVGVMPEGFALPDAGVDLWIPWDVSGDRPRDQHYLGAIARLKPGISIAQAEDQLNAVAADLGRAYPDTNSGWGVRLVPLQSETVGGAATVLWVLVGAVALVLLVVCANVALLTLMRGLDRSDETAVRLALGASSGRLLRELLAESIVLAAAGGALGAAIAAAGLRVLPALAVDLPRLDEVAFDLRTVVFIAGATFVAAVVSGLPQAWYRTRLAVAAAGSPRMTDNRRRHAFRDAMVACQVALAVVLLMGSGLFVRSFLHLRGTDPGFDPDNVLVAPVFLDTQAYDTGDRVRTYYRTLFDGLAAIPGVTAVGGATAVPTSPLGPDFERPVWPADAPTDPSVRMPASVRMVTPGYFRAIGFLVADGRAIDERDRPASPRVVVINETLAAHLWPGRRAVGQKLVVDYSSSGTYPYEIVGVVGDVRFGGPRSQPAPEIYLPHAQRPYLILNVVLRSDGDPRALVPAARAVLAEIDPQKPAHGFYPLADLVGATYARDRQTMFTLLLFAGTS